MIGKSWKTLALTSWIAASLGVHAEQSNFRGSQKADNGPQREPAPEIVLPDNVEQVNWFVDKDGRNLADASSRPLTELVAQTFVLQFIEAALVFTGLATELNGAGPFTMMITWDYEWDRQPYIKKFKSAPWRRHLREMLEYCIHEGDIPENALPSSSELYMMSGDSLSMTYDGTRSTIEGFRNIGTTVVSNGYVYLLQDVLQPPFMSQTVYSVAQNDNSVFASLLVKSGLHTALQSRAETVGYTVFVPTNTAFNKFNTGFVDYLNGNASERDAFLKYHMAKQVYPSMNMYANADVTVTTDQGGQLKMRMDSAGDIVVTATRNTANIVNKDKLAYNGLVHVVDTCLQFKTYSGISTPTPLDVTTHITNNSPNTSVFSNANSYQSKARSWVAGNCPNCGTDGVRIMQRYVLACIYYATYNVANALTNAVGGLSTWTQSGGWLTGSDECTWYGIECNDAGYVNIISLSDNKLSGSFPSETSLLKDSLEGLDLSKNSMYNDGTAGNDWLGDLAKLKYLSVSQTGFAYNGIPSSIGRLTELIDLDVSYCLYFGALNANVFSGLSKLTYLDISGNSYGSAAPTSIGSMASLMYFYAIDADITGDLNFITSSKRIVELWIDDNSGLTGAIPTTLGNMISLQSLSLADNALNGAIPTHLGKLVSMRQMFLYGNNFSGGIPTQFGNLAKLQRLEVYDNPSMSGSMPGQVCSIASLDNLEAGCFQTSFTCSCCSCCNNCRRSGDTA